MYRNKMLVVIMSNIKYTVLFREVGYFPPPFINTNAKMLGTLLQEDLSITVKHIFLESQRDYSYASMLIQYDKPIFI